MKKSSAKKQKPQLPAAPLFNDIYRTLLHQIFRGELRAGAVIAEEALASQFGVSRTPVREALIRLINDGFLEKGASRSYLVTEITIESIKNVFDLRYLLEPAAAAQAASNPLRMDALTRAGRILEEMRAWPREENEIERLLEFSGLDASFHETIAEASGNKRMAKFISELMKHSGHFWMLANSKGAPLVNTVQEHSNILEALRGGDPVKASEALRKHLLKSRGRLKV
jgi:DNA-binding GntR family transcriptional regulator